VDEIKTRISRLAVSWGIVCHVGCLGGMLVIISNPIYDELYFPACLAPSSLDSFKSKVYRVLCLCWALSKIRQSANPDGFISF